MTVARQFKSLLVGFAIIFGSLLLSATVLGDPAPGVLLGIVFGGTYYLVSLENTSRSSRSVGLVSLVVGTALFLTLLQLLGQINPMVVPRVELSPAQLSVCVVCIVLGPCMVFQGGARVACRVALKGAENDKSLSL